VDVCLHGAGNQVGCFGPRELTLWLDHVIRRTLREAGTPPGHGHSVETQPSSFSAGL